MEKTSMSWRLSRANRESDMQNSARHEIVGVLEPGVEVEGSVTVVSQGVLRLNAQLKGEVRSQATVVIGSQGNVEAELHGAVIEVDGKVRGDVHASERLEIRKDGLIVGDIFTPVLVIEPGGSLVGHCHMPVPSLEAEARGSQPTRNARGAVDPDEPDSARQEHQTLP